VHGSVRVPTVTSAPELGMAVSGAVVITVAEDGETRLVEIRPPAPGVAQKQSNTAEVHIMTARVFGSDICLPPVGPGLETERVVDCSG
jgi:hypothetical protein